MPYERIQIAREPDPPDLPAQHELQSCGPLNDGFDGRSCLVVVVVVAVVVAMVVGMVMR
jgi:hypothetical protein